jgi:hypothetical protein
MRKLAWVHFLLLIAGTTSINFPVLSTKSKERDLIISQNKQTNVSPAQRLIEVFRRRKRPGGTQGEFCSISPSINYRTTWSDRPLFVWQGTVTQIEVRLSDNQSVLWTHTVTEEEQRQQQVLYGGSALKPDQTYFYVYTYQTKDQGQTIDQTKSIQLDILSSESPKRRLIEAKLAELDNQKQNLSAEEYILKRSEIFAEQNLWLDVFREVYSLQNPSPEWDKIRQEQRPTLCN